MSDDERGGAVMRRGVLLAVLVTAFLAGCGSSEGSAGTENAGAADPKDSVAAAPTDAAGTAAPGCRVTRPNGRTAPGESLSQSFYGMTGLWTLLPVDGALRITSVTPVPPGATGGTVHSDGSLSTKFPWWGSRSASARLRIRAKRLDGGARQLRVCRAGVQRQIAPLLADATEVCDVGVLAGRCQVRPRAPHVHPVRASRARLIATGVGGSGRSGYPARPLTTFANWARPGALYDVISRAGYEPFSDAG